MSRSSTTPSTAASAAAPTSASDTGSTALLPMTLPAASGCCSAPTTWRSNPTGLAGLLASHHRRADGRARVRRRRQRPLIPYIDPYFGGIAMPGSPDPGWRPADYPHRHTHGAAPSVPGGDRAVRRINLAYCEEADLALRARAAGWTSGLVRGARVQNVHLGGPSPSSTAFQQRNTLRLVRTMSRWVPRVHPAAAEPLAGDVGGSASGERPAGVPPAGPPAGRPRLPVGSLRPAAAFDPGPPECSAATCPRGVGRHRETGKMARTAPISGRRHRLAERPLAICRPMASGTSATPK